MDFLFLVPVVIVILAGFGTFRYLQKRRKKNLKEWIKKQEEHALATSGISEEVKRFGEALNGVGKATAEPFKAMAESITSSVRTSRKVESSEYHGYSDHTNRSSTSKSSHHSNDGFGIGLAVGSSNSWNSHTHSGSSHSGCSGSSGSSDSGSSSSSDSGSCGD